MDYRSKEAFKTLRTNIQFCGTEIKVITITSCTPNEGKSSVSFNLAVSFAEAGKKVIFIDADLRKSVLIGRYKVGEVEYGMSHYLSGQRELSAVIYTTSCTNMDVIFSGDYSPNPSELLGHDRFIDMIRVLREVYDYVIIDTPPLGAVIDSAVVARMSDGAILVVEANTINHHFAKDVKEQLERSGCKIIGAVMNKVPVKMGGYYQKYYHKYYKHYGEYGGANKAYIGII